MVTTVQFNRTPVENSAGDNEMMNETWLSGNRAPRT